MQILFFIYGCCWGSFLMATATRYRNHQSLLYPSSHCDTCQTPLLPWQLVPVISYGVLRGRCSFCHSRIPSLTFIGELMMGLLATTVTDWHTGRLVLELSLWCLAALCDNRCQTFPGWISWGSFLLAAIGQPFPPICVTGSLIVLLHWCWPRWPRPLVGDGDLEFILCYWLTNGLLPSARWLLTACILALWLTRHTPPTTRIAFIPYLTTSALWWWLWPVS